jgi:hypothetical protein
MTGHHRTALLWQGERFPGLSLVLLHSIVTLSEAKGLSGFPGCHAERSEVSVSMGRDASLRST